MYALKKLILIIQFSCFYVFEILHSNIRVLVSVFMSRERLKPGIIAIPLDAKTHLEILLVTNLISMTPGTLSLDISTDKKTLYVHTMFTQNIEDTRNQIKNNYEKKVLEVLRR